VTRTREHIDPRLLRALTIVLLVVAFAALGLAANVRFGAVWRTLLATNGAALLLLATGVLNASWIATWRVVAKPSSTEHRRFFVQLVRWSRTALEAIGLDVLRAVCVGVLALLAFFVITQTWNVQPSATALGRAALIAGGSLLIVSFVLLVLERYFAGHAAPVWPEAMPLALTTRVTIATLLMTSCGVLFSGEAPIWGQRLITLAGILPAAVAIETALRALLAAFVRVAAYNEPRMLADSAFAGVMRWPPRPLRSLHDELRSRFGIDLRQNWAFAFMRRATLPIAAAVALFGWLMSGVHEVAVAGRAVHERFGRPVAVWESGIHIGLPWPFSRVRPVENGIVHELDVTVAGEETASELGTVEGPAPGSANRLWDASHISENSQVIASASGDRQSFQVVNMDVRIVYRIALTDAAALAVTYQSADIPALIRSTASRVLVRHFAAQTLDGVIGESRTALAAHVREAVQTDLDALDSGVEILATLIEAVHPPAGAANAYRSVQAAQIKSQATIARERGRTAQQVNEARLQASMANDKAMAAAREALMQANIAQLKFAAERDAHQRAGKAFLLEQYLSQLAQGLSSTDLVIVDHRLESGQSPTIDLRAYSTGADGTKASQ
jgi:regulator of protease activity HflC (stomatin/prohibitin superfamily)